MSPESFSHAAQALLRAHLRSPFRVVEEKIYPGGTGASINVAFGSLLLRATYDRRYPDYYCEVSASGNQIKWYELNYLLAFATGAVPAPSNVGVGHSIADLEETIRRFGMCADEVAVLLSSERIADTERRLKEAKLANMHPTLRRFVK